MNELIHVCGQETTVGFEVLPLPKRQYIRKEGSRKPGRPAKSVAVMDKPKGKVGRPRKYNGTHRRIVAAALKKFGLTKGIEFLEKERNLKVSVTLALSVKEQFGIELKRGRPAA
jgi:hypothetical protein